VIATGERILAYQKRPICANKDKEAAMRSEGGIFRQKAQLGVKVQSRSKFVTCEEQEGHCDWRDSCT
jgi:hypothetical protein